jgi:hypothetical protein
MTRDIRARLWFSAEFIQSRMARAKLRLSAQISGLPLALRT